MRQEASPVIRTLLALVALAALAGPVPPAAADELPPPRTVYEVDLDRYMGLWHEIARLPNRFQDDCVGNVTAEYRMRDDGRIDVVNRCLEADGSVNEAEGVARSTNPPRDSRLEVSFVSVFGKRLFWGDYWVLGLGEDYEWVVVGHPERKYGWVLSRSRTLPPETMDRVLGILRSSGYDPAEFVFAGS